MKHAFEEQSFQPSFEPLLKINRLKIHHLSAALPTTYNTQTTTTILTSLYQCKLNLNLK